MILRDLNLIFVRLSGIFYLIFSPVQLFAQPKLPPPVTAIGSTLKDFIDLIIEILQAVGLPIMVVFIIYSGYLLVSAGDNEEQVTKSKRWILWTLVGASIILSAQVIADLIFNTAGLF